MVRAWGSRAVAGVRWRLWQRAPLLRLALHPQDLAHPVTEASLKHELERWVRARTVVSYAQL